MRSDTRLYEYGFIHSYFYECGTENLFFEDLISPLLIIVSKSRTNRFIATKQPSLKGYLMQVLHQVHD